VSLPVHYCDGRHPIRTPATFVWRTDTATLLGDGLSRIYAVRELQVSPRVLGADRFIALPDGGQVHCADQAALDSLPQEVVSEGPVSWLEQRWGYAVLCIVLIAATLAAGYFYGLPAAAAYVAPRIPIEHEVDIGKQALAWLDRKGWMSPTLLPREQQTQI